MNARQRNKYLHLRVPCAYLDKDSTYDADGREYDMSFCFARQEYHCPGCCKNYKPKYSIKKTKQL